ncbi:MAG: ABC transporter substrate-binding protein [Candidatus Sifarchaeia archaeon]
MKPIRKILCVFITITLFFPVSGISLVSAQEQEMLFVMAYGSDIGELNPLTARSMRSAWYDMLVYDTLITYDDDLDKIPWLAESWSVSSDGLTINFTIRSGAVWHDGEDVTASDVEFTFEYIRDGPSDLNGWSMMQNITNIVTDGDTVSCMFNQLYSFALDTLGSFWIIPEHIRNGTSPMNARWNDHNDVEAHIGSGPFKFVERVPDEYTLLTRNDDWWGPDNQYVGQLPNIDAIRIDVIISQEARILAMRKGTADTERYEVFGAYVNEVMTYPELQLVQGVVSQWDYNWGFNVTIPGLNDINVRRALSMAVNRTELINVGRLGYGTSAGAAIPSVFFPDLYDSDADFPDGDVAGANAILDSAGYVDLDGDGTRNFPDDLETELEFDLLTLSWDDISVATGSGLVSQMASINVTLHNIVYDDLPMYVAIYTGEYEMFTMGSSFSPIPDHVWWRTHSSNIYDWGENVFGINNASVDSIMDDFMAATPSELPEAARNASVSILHNIPYVPLYLSDDTHIIRKEWVNFTTPAGGPFVTYNPRTMIFMYDNGSGTVYIENDQTILIIAIGAAAFIAGIVVVVFLVRRK